MGLLNKINININGLWILFALGSVVLAILFYREYQLNQETEAIKVEFAQLQDDIARAETHIVSQEELLRIAKKESRNYQAIVDGLQNRVTVLKSVIKTKLKIPGKSGKKVPSTKVEKKADLKDIMYCKDKGVPLDLHGYTEEVQFLDLMDVMEQHVATITFDAAEPDPWAFAIPARDVEITNHFYEDSSGQLIVFTQIDSCVGKHCVPMKIHSSEVFGILQPAARFRWWDPHLELAVAAGAASDGTLSIGPELGLPFMSYGRTRNDNQLRFFKPTFGMTKDQDSYVPYIGLTLGEVNIAKYFPLLEDTWLGMGLGLDTRTRKLFHLTLGTTF